MPDAVMKQSLTPEAVKAFTCPTSGYVVKLSDNTVGLDFMEFMIRDQASGDVFFEVKRDQEHQPPASSLPDDLPPELEDMVRHVRYCVPKNMLQCKILETRLMFTVGQDVPTLRLIERHYFKGEFVKEYDMEHGPCSQGGPNIWNAKYTMPEDSPQRIADYVRTPGGHCTDSFYFVGDQLVVHNKATFTYADDGGSVDTSPAAASTAPAGAVVEDRAVKVAIPSIALEADSLAEEIGKLQSA